MADPQSNPEESARKCECCQQSFSPKGNRKFCGACLRKVCPTCGRTFDMTAKALRRVMKCSPKLTPTGWSGVPHCSAECYQRNRFRLLGEPLICDICQKPLQRGRFCSRSCRLVSLRKRDRMRAPAGRFVQRQKGWELKKIFMRELGGKCVQCGLDDLRVLEFNHKNPSTKLKEGYNQHHPKRGNPSLQARLRTLRKE